MKQILTLISLLLLIIITSHAQAPQGIPYQAAARNSTGAVLASTAISVRFTIRDSIATGIIKYRETHSITTDANGMFSLVIGQGSPVTGTFTAINWGTNAKFQQVEMDPTGASSYIDLGTQQMMSVPFAKYAVRSGNGFTHYVGEVWGGGVVYYVYRGEDGQEHGLIVATTDQSTGTAWSNVTGTAIGLSAQSKWNGLANSNAIVSQEGHTNSAAKLCLDLVSGGYYDWYLPSIEELNLLFNTQFNINKTLYSIVGATELNQEWPYWSSSEGGAGWAFSEWFGLTYNYSGSSKIDDYSYVRAIRAY